MAQRYRDLLLPFAEVAVTQWILELRVQVDEERDGEPAEWDINDWIDHLHAYTGRAFVFSAITDPNEAA